MTDAPNGEQRRLQAIMFSDMWGYSRMMSEDQARTIRLVEEHRAIVRAILPRFDGREHETIGDAFVVLFDSARQAVAGAVEIQRALGARNVGKPPEEQIWLRIGLHLDDIVLRDGHIYGDGVNVAARIEPLADKGGILVSEAIVSHTDGKVPVTYKALPKTPLKNIKHPPPLFAVLADGLPVPRRRPPHRSRAPLVIAAAVALAVVVGAVALRAWRPLSPSQDAIAAAKYQEGLARIADLDVDGMYGAFRAALERDSGLAGAHLRIAGWAFHDTPLPAREHFVAAQQHRDRLDAHDRLLLEALEPYVATRIDTAAFVDKATAAFRAQETNELRFWASYALFRAGRYAHAQALAEAGPHSHYLPLAWAAAISATQRPDQGEVARAHLERCAQKGTRSTHCHKLLALMHMRSGRCQQMEDVARRWVSEARADPEAEHVLAYALAARGAPLEGVVEVMGRARTKYPEASTPLVQAMDRTRVACWIGAFDDAEQSARAWLASLGTHPDVAMQVMPTSYVIGALLERGDTAAAVDEAKAFLRRAPAFDPDAFGDDWTIFFENVIAKGATDDASADRIEAVRQKWVTQQRARLSQREHLVHHWRDAWGEWVRTPEEARRALAAYDALVKDGLTLPPDAAIDAGLALAVGQTRLLAGDAAGARPLLERAATSCTGLLEPLRMTRVWLMLARARRDLGDVAGARAAYDIVIERWGDAPRSITVTAARAERAALP